MITPWRTKVKSAIFRAIHKIVGHKYGCCDKHFYPCWMCKYVIEDRKAIKELRKREKEAGS